jgi:hypothetical protein
MEATGKIKYKSATNKEVDAKTIFSTKTAMKRINSAKERK